MFRDESSDDLEKQKQFDGTGKIYFYTGFDVIKTREEHDVELISNDDAAGPYNLEAEWRTAAADPNV